MLTQSTHLLNKSTHIHIYKLWLLQQHIYIDFQFDAITLHRTHAVVLITKYFVTVWFAYQDSVCGPAKHFTHMWLVKISFQNLEHQYVALTVSTLARLSTRFWGLATEIWLYSKAVLRLRCGCWTVRQRSDRQQWCRNKCSLFFCSNVQWECQHRRLWGEKILISSSYLIVSHNISTSMLLTT